MTGYDLHVTNTGRKPTDEQYLEFIEIMEGIRLALSYLGTRRPPGSTSRGALELVAGSISGEKDSLAERLGDGLAGTRNAFDRLSDVQLAGSDATTRYRYQAQTLGPFVMADESVREFVDDWFELTGDPADLIPRRIVNERYSSWCERNLISREDRVTTSVLRASLKLLGVDLVGGRTEATDGEHVRHHAFVGIRRRAGA